MAFAELNSLALPCSLLVLLCLHTVSGMSGWAGCFDGQDVFATVRENSLSGELIAELMVDTTMEGVHWSLDGKDADWFFLEDRSIRLNTSDDKILDREALGPVLVAQLVCYEDNILQSMHRILVEIIDENDNSPVFAENTVQSLMISELTPVNTVIFTLQATDADNNKIIYLIDQTSPDAEYFKVLLPNSGEVILAKPLDYETKTQITVTIYASEMNTAERFNASVTITITVVDGDDQYPYFEPCVLLLEDETNRICTSPVYTVNVTEGEEDIVLDFSPGPIHAVDGDKALNSPVSYAILSGDDEGHFWMDKETGELRLTRGVTNRLTTPVLHLQVMAYQENDPRKYSLATAVIRVLAVNQYYPEFDMAEYHGFITEGQSPASLVNTYGSKALILHVQDQDFSQGLNPMIYFAFSPTSNHTDIYQVTHEGLLVARQSELKPKQKHILEVMAVDQESGDATFATVVVEVLSEGQSIPHGALGDGRVTGCTVGKALFLSMVFMTVIGCMVWVIMWLKKKRKVKRNPLERGCVAQGKHPNVSLRWFQLVSHGGAMPHMDVVPYSNEEYGTCNPSFSFPEKQDVYTHRDLSTSRGTTQTRTSLAAANAVGSSVILDANASKSSSGSPTCNPAAENANPAVQDAASVTENHNSPLNATLDSTETQPNTGPCPVDLDASLTPSLTRSNSQATTVDDLADPVTSPSSQCSVPCSLTRIASAEIEKPIRKPRVKTPPYSPLLTSPFSKQRGTSPPTPDHALLKATLVHIDTTPTDSPPETPGQASVTLIMEEDEPSTSLDHIDDEPMPPEGTADIDSPSQDRRLSTISANTQDGRVAGDEDDDGFLGDEDADKSSDGELEPDEEELLRVLARCNPIFISFTK
ncbi:uncharacterized protein LOC115391591 [Salarias fasciatus]|uniref:uncharacterized protein LOC115391591 n=1 Tax=Salarias fasciatus TaxID=181472 RepID=UPI001176A402|nr:uncharacterized protein LOC115391591 [Salarias fasciatus]